MAEQLQSNPTSRFQGEPPALYTKTIWISFLVCLFVGQIFFGSYGAAAASVIALLAVPQFIWTEPRKRLAAKKVIFLFPLVFVLLLIAFIFSAEDASDMMFIFNFTSFVAVLPIVALARKNAGAEWIYYIAVAALLGAFCAFGLSAYQVFYLGMSRAGGIVSNANIISHVTLVFALFSLAGIYPFTSRWRSLFLLGPIFTFFVLLLTGSRGSLLAFIPAMLFGLVFVGQNQRVRRWIFGLAASAVILIGIGFAYTDVFDAQVERVAKGTQVIATVLQEGHAKEWSTFMRIELYKGAVRAFWEKPVVGHGWQDAIFEASKSIEGEHPRRKIPNAKIASTWPNMHNDFLGFAAGAGLFGIVSYILLLLIPLLAIGKRDTFFAQRLYVGTSLVSLTAVHGLVDAPFGTGISVMTYAFASALLIGTFQDIDRPSERPPPDSE